MIAPRQERLAGSFGWRTTRDPRGLVERVLRALGADAMFVDDVLGDLTEQRALLGERRGAAVARLWYARQVMLAMPHLAWNAVRHGGREGVARLAATVAVVVTAPVLLLLALNTLIGGPSRLVIEGQRGRALSEGLIVNSRHPVRLAVKAFDSHNRVMSAKDVQYRWAGGMPMHVSPNGVITCPAPGDAWVRASQGHAATTVEVQCRPVRAVGTYSSILLVAGDDPRPYSFEAWGPDGHTVWELAGEQYVTDTTVAVLRDNLIIPRKPGRTNILVVMGDGVAKTSLTVFEPVPSLEGLRPDQRVAIAPLEVARGDTSTIALPFGRFWLKVHGATPATMPVRSVTGPVTCYPRFSATTDRVYCTVRAAGAALHVSGPRGRAVDARLSIDFDDMIHL